MSEYDYITINIIDLTECRNQLDKLFLLNPCNEITEYRQTFIKYRIAEIIKQFTDSCLKNNMPSKRFIKLIETIIKVCDVVYYTTDHEELLSDNLYVPAYNCYSKITKETLHQNTPLITKLEKTQHGYPNLKGSLDKVNNFDNLKKWFQKIITTCNLHWDYTFSIALSYKYDGVSVVLEFDSNGKLLKAVTRGEGDVGNDVTARFSHIKCGFKCETGVKTEAILTEENLQKYNAMTNNSYKNRRSGITSLLNSATSPSYLIDLVPLDIEFNTSNMKLPPNSKLQYLSDRKCITPSQPFIYKSISGDYKMCLDEILQFINYTEDTRNTLNYPLDGVVLDILNPEIRSILGRKNDINLFQMAYKFEAQNTETTLREVFYTVGKTGKITPMAVFDEIFFDSVRYDKCTISSYGTMMSLFLSYNDTIVIQRSGDVIPYLSANMGGGQELIIFPTECPECGCKLIIKKEHAYCINNECRGRFKARLLSIVDKLDIENLGEDNLNTLVDNNIIINYTDLFIPNTLNYIEQNIANGVKISNNIINTISKEITEDKMLYALSLDNIAYETARKISATIPIEDLINMDRERLKQRLIAINGIGSITANSVTEQIDKDHEFIDFMVFNFNIVKRPFTILKYYTTTGWRPDNIMKREYEQIGYMYKENLTKNCNLLVSNNILKTSPKTEKALEYGVEILGREDFEKLYEMYSHK